MTDYKYLFIEPHGKQKLIKVIRTGETVAGITAKGILLTFEHIDLGQLTDDELLELLSIPPNQEVETG